MAAQGSFCCCTTGGLGAWNRNEQSCSAKNAKKGSPKYLTESRIFGFKDSSSNTCCVGAAPQGSLLAG